MPDAANDENGVALLHLASRAKRAIGRTAHGSLGPFVRANNDLSSSILEVGILIVRESASFLRRFSGPEDLPLQLTRDQGGSFHHYPQDDRNVVPCRRGGAVVLSTEILD